MNLERYIRRTACTRVGIINVYEYIREGKRSAYAQLSLHFTKYIYMLKSPVCFDLYLETPFHGGACKKNLSVIREEIKAHRALHFLSKSRKK